MLVLHHRPSASTRSATSSAASGSRPTTSRATWPGWRRSRSARPGTTTTTRSRRPRPTACAAARSTPRPRVIWRLERLGLAWDVVRISPRAPGREPRRGRCRAAVTTTHRCARRSPSALPDRPFTHRPVGRHVAAADQRQRGRRSPSARPRALAHVLRAPRPARARAGVRRGRDRGRRPRHGPRPARHLEAAAARPAHEGEARRRRGACDRADAAAQAARGASCARAGAGTRASATSARSATTTTSATSSSRCSSTSR